MGEKTGESLYNTTVEQIVNMAWSLYPTDPEARLRIYDRIAENFSALARVLRRGENEKSFAEKAAAKFRSKEGLDDS